MNRKQATPYISLYVDDALSERTSTDMPRNAQDLPAAEVKLVGWQCGFEPLFVAVWSYLGNFIDDADAEDIARDLLTEKKWFSGEPKDADYII